LINATSKAQKAQTLTERATIVKARGGARLEKGSKESLASLILKRPVGEETTLLLDAKVTRNPVQRARQLKSRMQGDVQAEQGLRQSFREALWNKAKTTGGDAEGFDLQSARVFTRLVRDNIDTMKALGFTDQFKPELGDIQNMQRLAKQMRQAELKPSSADKGRADVFTDIPGAVINRASRLLGAKLGNWIQRITGGGSAGTSIQAAGMGAGSAAEVTKALRVDPAEQLLSAAMDDGTLMKALFLRSNATEAAKKQAASRLNAWAFGVGLTDEEDSK
jgi:hypothetical protein